MQCRFPSSCDDSGDHQGCLSLPHPAYMLLPVAGTPPTRPTHQPFTSRVTPANVKGVASHIIRGSVFCPGGSPKPSRPRTLPHHAHHAAHSPPRTGSPDALLGSPAPATAVLSRGLKVVQALLQLWRLQHSSSNSSSSSSSSSSTHSSSQAPQQPYDSEAAYAVAVQQLLSELGPLWVKLGQTLAVRPDVVGSKLAVALSGLQESAPPMPADVAAAVLQQELGAPPCEVFAWWSPTPVASASLSQVYQARLKGSGQLMAVKVQRPGLESLIALDLSVLSALLGLLRRVGGIKQDITAWATTLGQGLAQELDYVQEAHNLCDFASAHAYLGFVDTPAVVWELTTHRVLTTTWVEGKTPGQILRTMRAAARPDRHDKARAAAGAGSSAHRPNLLAMGQAHSQHLQQHVKEASEQQTAQQQQQQQHSQQQLLRLVDLGIEASLHQLMVTGLLHADPHPGNLLLCGDRLVYLDFGLLVKVPPEASVAMMAALLHWSQANWLALAADMRAMGLLKPTTDLHELAADLQQSFQQYAAGSSEGAVPQTVNGPQQQHLQARREGSQAAIAVVAQQAAARQPQAGCVYQQQQQQGSTALLLQKAGAIGFSQFAGVIASLALKYRFELPPYYTLVIRSLTTLEGFALLVDPTAQHSIARTAVRVVAKQLLLDERPQAATLLQELLVLQDAPGHKSRSCRLNMQLLQELLQLMGPLPTAPAEAQHDTIHVCSSQPTCDAQARPAAQADAIRVTPAAPAAPQASSNSRILQPLDLVARCQQRLGLSASMLAAHLSSPEAAPVRELLAQQLLSRWWDRPKQQWQQQKLQGREHQQRQQQPAAGSAGPAAACNMQWQLGQRPSLLTWTLFKAGVGGLKLAVQLLRCVGAVLYARALVCLQQCLRWLHVTRG